MCQLTITAFVGCLEISIETFNLLLNGVFLRNIAIVKFISCWGDGCPCLISWIKTAIWNLWPQQFHVCKLIPFLYCFHPELHTSILSRHTKKRIWWPLGTRCLGLLQCFGVSKNWIISLIVKSLIRLTYLVGTCCLSTETLNSCYIPTSNPSLACFASLVYVTKNQECKLIARSDLLLICTHNKHLGKSPNGYHNLSAPNLKIMYYGTYLVQAISPGRCLCGILGKFKFLNGQQNGQNGLHLACSII